MTTIHWTQGMQFAATREQLRKRSRDYYRRLLDLSQQESIEVAGWRFDNHHIIYLLELFWRDVWLANEGCLPDARREPPL
jgi:hypothetical protein